MATGVAQHKGLTGVEAALMRGDLAALNTEERLAYYRQVCESLGLNPLTRPFDYVTLQGKLQLYARKDCTEQLRKLHGITVQIVSREAADDIMVVHVRASMPKAGGIPRIDEDVGAVAVGNLKGEAKANAVMKAITKAKRRVTLSICGLGFLDESEVAAIPDAVVGEQPPPEAKPPLAAPARQDRAKKVVARVHAVEQEMVAAGLCEGGDLMRWLDEQCGPTWSGAPGDDIKVAVDEFRWAREEAKAEAAAK